MPQTDCPMCETILADGDAVLFSGDVLVDARCWTDPNKSPAKIAGKRQKKGQKPAEEHGESAASA